MPRPDERRVVYRFVVATLGWLAALFGWACILSFDIADPPGDLIWPQNAVTANWCGSVGATAAYYAFYYLGIGVFPLLALFTLAVLVWSRGRALPALWPRFVGVALICTATAACGALLPAGGDWYTMCGAGGVLGGATASFLVAHTSLFGTLIVCVTAALLGLFLAAEDLVLGFIRGALWARETGVPALARGSATVVAAGSAVVSAGAAAARTGAKVASGVAELTARIAAARPNGVDSPAGVERGREPAMAACSRPAAPTDDVDAADEVPLVAPGPLPSPRVSRIELHPPDGGKSAGKAPTAKTALRPEQQRLFELQPADQDYKLPPIDLLDAPAPLDKSAIEILCREKAYVLEQTLNEFRLEVQVVAIETGPVITVFELKLAPGIKVSQVASLTNDMARALRAPAVRVVAPLPGKNTIGIEVPNIDKEKVRLRDVMESFAARNEAFAIPLYLGKDASGQPLVTDLTRMPHLLIAGTTGSGKSVCVSSIVMSVLMTRTPAEVQLIMLDPKVVELAMYKDVPHLMCPIVTDIAKAEAILDWAATKMDERYALLAEAGVKDIRAYNRLGPDELKARLQADDEDMKRIPIRLPYIVIVVDELADLMMMSPKEVEFYLCRIAQKSRAVGIHLIVSTQRPQANVVTGLIKSNLPCRIAFRVSSRLDSRIVLDQNGGEVLMGQGDMLFLPPGSAKLMRAQGTFIADDELKRVVQHCKQQRGPQYHPELVKIPGGKPGESGAGERDELFDQAVEIILESGRGSVSLLQRKLTIGYGRASRLVDQMAEAGIVGEYKGSQAREVLMTLEEWRAARAQRDREEAGEARAERDLEPFDSNPA